MTTQTPLVLGWTRNEDKNKRGPSTVHPFKLLGNIALPGSSLRGLISATAEAASNSALRILEDSDLFEKVHPDLVPLGKSARRKNLTPAELLFGFVEERSQSSKLDDQALALASRVSFSYATSASQVADGKEVTLRELSSPKTKHDAFYKNGKLPKGRKFYVAAGDERHESGLRNPTHRQVKVKPVATGSRFWFAVDFENVSDEELDLLCYSITPNIEYRHRLGMGKSIGLGVVQIEIAGLFLIDRKRRYSGQPPMDGAAWWHEARYHESWISIEEHLTSDKWPAESFPLEREVVDTVAIPAPAARAATFRNAALLTHHNAVEALELLGNPKAPEFPVHYPAKAGHDLETGIFKWFTDPSLSTQDLGNLPNNGKLPSLAR